jgi:segregation and condensation protein A
MASTLLLIKSRMLLPRPETAVTEDGEEILDPRKELVARLIEYQQFQQVSEHLRARPILGVDQWVRGDSTDHITVDPEEGVEIAEMSIFELVDALQSVLMRAPDPVHEIEGEQITIQDCILEIRDLIQAEDSSELLFESLFRADLTRRRIVSMFLAMLELIRMKMVRVFQTEPYGPIRIRIRGDLKQLDLTNVESFSNAAV